VIFVPVLPKIEQIDVLRVTSILADNDGTAIFHLMPSERRCGYDRKRQKTHI